MLTPHSILSLLVSNDYPAPSKKKSSILHSKIRALSLAKDFVGQINNEIMNIF